MADRNYFISKLVFVISVLFFLSCQFQKLQYSPDDTFIYLKYARNLAEGNNFSFNAGEPSYGVTSPLWTVIVAPAFIISSNGFWFAKITDLIFFSAACLFMFLLSGKFFNENKIFKFICLSIFILNPWIIRSVFTGMETSFAVFYVTLLFYLFYSKKFTLLFILAGLSFIVRPEIILLFLIFSGIVILKHKSLGLEFKKALFLPAISLVIMCFYWIFAHYNFGTIFPNTGSGKAVLSSDFELITSNAKQILRIFTLVNPLEILFALLSLVFVWRSKKQDYLPLIFWVIGLLLLYILTTSAVMARYFLILYPVIVILATSSFEIISAKKKSIVLIFIILFFVYSQYTYYAYIKSYCENFTRGVNECLIPIGKWLDTNTPENTRVLVNDVGAIGYSTSRYIIDAAALINRDLNLNKKIMSVPNIEKEYPHLMLNFIETDYLIEKDTVRINSLQNSYNFKLEPKAHFVFPQMWVLDPNPKYYTIYKVTR